MHPLRFKLGARILVALAMTTFSSCGAETPEAADRSDGHAGQGQAAASMEGGAASDAATQSVEPAPGQPSSAPDAPAAQQTNANGAVLQPCAGASVTARAELLPSDIVWAIDTSGSLAFAFEAIQDALNVFSRKIVDAGIDAHVIVLAGAAGGRASTTGMCVPAPLGSGQCGAAAVPLGPAPDSKEPSFLHLDTPVAANGGTKVLLVHFPAYKHLLRPHARTHLVLTEDGPPFGGPEDGALPGGAQAVVDHLEGRRSATSAPPFMPGLRPGSWTFNAVVCKDGVNLGACLLAGLPLTSTLQLVQMTGGVLSDLNNAGDPALDPFVELLDKLAQRVIVEARLGCVYDIPPPPTGMMFDSRQVNVLFSGGAAAPITFPRLPDGRSCEQNEAWRYDQPSAPSKVELCPAACARIQKDTAPRIDLKFGCQSAVLVL